MDGVHLDAAVMTPYIRCYLSGIGMLIQQICYVSSSLYCSCLCFLSSYPMAYHFCKSLLFSLRSTCLVRSGWPHIYQPLAMLIFNLYRPCGTHSFSHNGLYLVIKQRRLFKACRCYCSLNADAWHCDLFCMLLDWLGSISRMIHLVDV
jgi:hypothetical protein